MTFTRPIDHPERIGRAQLSLRGLAIGDGFGERFFGNPDSIEWIIEQRAVPEGPWPYTDDTVMALSIVEVLEDFGFIEQDGLAARFADKYARDPQRGYGGTAHGILQQLGVGLHWRLVSSSVFNGMGSMGNGGAMRAAPVGAYFADSAETAAEQARRSAEVTHAHFEGQAGAVAVAVAAAWAAGPHGDADELFEIVLRHVPEGETRAAIARAAALPREYDVQTAVAALGNGSHVIAQDTVPFALWCAARHLGDYEQALWTTVSGLGDRDTTCAIVGGIVALADQGASIPEAWSRCLEPLEVMARRRQ